MNGTDAMTNEVQARLAGVALPPGVEPFAGVFAHAPHLASREAKYRRKRCANLEDAVRRSGLKSGMTVSFHHAFREGDKVINAVVACLASMGFRDLTLAPSSLLSCNAPLIAAPWPASWPCSGATASLPRRRRWGCVTSQPARR